ncbi:hypothetical protein WDU94_005452 [Cyamophila willieti]
MYYNTLANKNSSSTSSQSSSSNVNLTKLQPLELPSFNGNIQDWPMFYNLYKINVHDRSDLPKSHKLQHLLSKLTCKACAIASGIPPVEENYDVLFKAPISKYEDKRNLANHHLESLFKFKPCKVESHQQLQLFVDKFGSTVAALKALEIDDLQEYLLFYIGHQRLDPHTMKAFESS